jgi:FKBP-type peptidyl-prolyl cis-trans isomerase FkpA
MTPRYLPLVVAAMTAASSILAEDAKKSADAPPPPPAEPAAAAAPAIDMNADPFAGVRMDIVSYAIANNMGKQMGQQGIKPDYENYIKGLKDGITGEKAKFTEAEIQEGMMKFQSAMQAAGAQAGARSAAVGKKALDENGKRKGVTTTASGLQYEVMKAAEGAKPKATDTVTVHYKGTLITGKEFDSSYSRGEPASFPLNGVIPGWTEGLQLMNVGSKYKFMIPSQLAYGENGPPSIGANQTLIFEVELLKIGAEEPKAPEAAPEAPAPEKK